MIIQATDNYSLHFFDNYVIAEGKEGAVIGNEEVKQGLKVIFDHFKGKEFTLISHRKNNYVVSIDIYTLKLMKKLKALAVVSKDSMVRKQAIAEQTQFDKSFAFFTELEDAIGWAESVISN